MSFSLQAAWGYIAVLVWVVLCLWRGQRQGKINLWDMVTATDKSGVPRTDARKFFECGAFVVMTVAFSYLVVVDKLSEAYAAIYVGTWVAARSMRDREQRLNRVLDMAKEKGGEAPQDKPAG